MPASTIHNLLFNLRIDSLGRSSGEIVHLLLDICWCRSGLPVRIGPGLPGDFTQHLNQCVHIFFAVLDAKTHPDESRQADLRQQGQDQALKLCQEWMNVDQTFDQKMSAVSAGSHADPTSLGQFFGNPVGHHILQIKDNDASFLGEPG